jgi:hypothetical protein
VVGAISGTTVVAEVDGVVALIAIAEVAETSEVRAPLLQ